MTLLIKFLFRLTFHSYPVEVNIDLFTENQAFSKNSQGDVLFPKVVIQIVICFLSFICIISCVRKAVKGGPVTAKKTKCCMFGLRLLMYCAAVTLQVSTAASLTTRA